MRIFNIIANAQSRRVFQNMGEAFGYSDEAMARAVRYFIPPITKAIARRAETTEGLLSVLEFLGSRRFDRFLDDARIFGHAEVQKEGERALDYLFQRQARIRKIVENRAKVLPIDADTLMSMFPFLAVVIVGAIEVRTRRPLGAVLHRLSGGSADQRAVANPYLALAHYLSEIEKEQRDKRRWKLFRFVAPQEDAADEERLRPRVEGFLQSA